MNPSDACAEEIATLLFCALPSLDHADQRRLMRAVLAIVEREVWRERVLLQDFYEKLAIEEVHKDRQVTRGVYTCQSSS